MPAKPVVCSREALDMACKPLVARSIRKTFFKAKVVFRNAQDVRLAHTAQ